ncbi:MAG: amidohydrolase family protein [Chloroflexi bacterium]|nr:amidohydrolase family protein [Chloroflexota bacterium]
MSISAEHGPYEIIDAFACIGQQPDDDRDLSAAALLTEMDRERIGRTLAMSFAAVRYDQARGNRELAAYCAEHPRLVPVAVINPAPYVDLPAQIAACAQPPFAGLRFTPYRQSWSLHSEPFMRALALADAAGMPISVETGASGDATWLASLSDGLHIPLILANITYATMGEALAVLEAHPRLHLELTRLVSPGIVELLVSCLGCERLLFGSGAPGWALSPTLEMIRCSDIIPEAKAALLGGNARRIYHLDYEAPR